MTAQAYVEGTPSGQAKERTDKQKGDAKVPGMDKLRITYGFWLSIFGLGLAATLAVFLVLLKFGDGDASEVTAVVGLFTSVLGTLVGAFFGLQIGAEGKEKAEEKAEEADKKVERAEERVEKERQKVFALQSVASPDLILQAQDMNPMAFQ